MAKRLTNAEIIARFWAACEGHDLHGKMPTIQQLREWTGTCGMDRLITRRYTMSVFARMVGLEPNKLGRKSPDDEPILPYPPPSLLETPEQAIPLNGKIEYNKSLITNRCLDCEWIRDGMRYCVLPKCFRRKPM